MKTYESNSSGVVKTITGGGIILLLLLLISTVIGIIQDSVIAPLLTGTIVSIVIYFYAISLKKVNLDQHRLELIKNFGRVKMKINEIQGIERLAYSDLTMTVGSKGFFGFIGATMDNSYSLVKDRRKMVKVITPDKKYIFSCENPNELVEAVQILIQPKA